MYSRLTRKQVRCRSVPATCRRTLRQHRTKDYAADLVRMECFRVRSPVAVMGGGAQSTAAKAGGASQPVLYVEFRKNGFPSIPARGGPQTKARRFADIMRKTSLILLGAVAGVAVTLIVRRCSQIR